MKDDQLRELLTRYRGQLIAVLRDSRHAPVPRRFESEGIIGPYQALQHALWMIDQVTRFAGLDEPSSKTVPLWPEDKAQRWLGFIRGVLWMSGVYSIREMQDSGYASLPIPRSPSR